MIIITKIIYNSNDNILLLLYKSWKKKRSWATSHESQTKRTQINLKCSINDCNILPPIDETIFAMRPRQRVHIQQRIMSSVKIAHIFHFEAHESM